MMMMILLPPVFLPSALLPLQNYHHHHRPHHHHLHAAASPSPSSSRPSSSSSYSSSLSSSCSSSSLLGPPFPMMMLPMMLPLSIQLPVLAHGNDGDGAGDDGGVVVVLGDGHSQTSDDGECDDESADGVAAETGCGGAVVNHHTAFFWHQSWSSQRKKAKAVRNKVGIAMVTKESPLLFSPDFCSQQAKKS